MHNEQNFLRSYYAIHGNKMFFWRIQFTNFTTHKFILDHVNSYPQRVLAGISNQTRCYVSVLHATFADCHLQSNFQTRISFPNKQTIFSFKKKQEFKRKCFHCQLLHVLKQKLSLFWGVIRHKRQHIWENFFPDFLCHFQQKTSFSPYIEDFFDGNENKVRKMFIQVRKSTLVFNYVVR